MFLIPKSTMQMTYLQTQTLIMYRPTIENVKQKFKAVKERKQICDVASCHAWVASQEAHLFNVVCPTFYSAQSEFPSELPGSSNITFCTRCSSNPS